MKEGVSIQNSQNLYTPLYKILSIFFLFTFLIFSFFYILIQSRNTELKNAYLTLGIEGKKSFSTITAYHQVLSGNQKRHIYTYRVTDEYGQIHEINEFVDSKSHLRLRVGNTVVTRQKKITLAGKEKILSRIEGNNQILPNLNFLESIALFGINFSVFGGIISFLLFLLKRKK